jgi:hypothetical protein
MVRVAPDDSGHIADMGRCGSSKQTIPLKGKPLDSEIPYACSGAERKQRALRKR